MFDTTLGKFAAALAALANTQTDEEAKYAHVDGYNFGWRCYENNWPDMVETAGEWRGFADARDHYAAWKRLAQAVA